MYKRTSTNIIDNFIDVEKKKQQDKLIKHLTVQKREVLVNKESDNHSFNYCVLKF